MSDGITIGGHEPPQEGGEYATAIADLVERGVRWADVSEADRELLALLYAAEHCEDTMIGHALERSLWTAIARVHKFVRAHQLATGPALAESQRKLAASASVQYEKLAAAAMAECEPIVKRHYADRWAEAHADAPDAVHPGAGR